MSRVIFWGFKNKELIKVFEDFLPSHTTRVFQINTEKRASLEKELSSSEKSYDFIESDSTHFYNLENALLRTEVSYVFFDFYSIFYEKRGPLSAFEFSKLKNLLGLKQSYIFLLPLYRAIEKNSLKRILSESSCKLAEDYFEQIRALYELVINSYPANSYILGSPPVFSHLKELFLDFDKKLSFIEGKVPFVFKLYPMSFVGLNNYTREVKSLMSRIEDKNDNSAHLIELKASEDNPYYKKSLLIRILRKVFLTRFYLGMPFFRGKKAQRRVLIFYVFLSILSYFSKK
jgi:hypothetical protein